VSTGTTRVLLAAVVVVAAALVGVHLLPGERGVAVPADDADPAQQVASLTRDLSPDGPYQVPTPAEQRAVVDALLRMIDQGAQSASQALKAVDYSVREGVDPATGRRYAVAADDVSKGRGWGLVVLDLSTTLRRVVEVPHPKSDARSEEVGLALFDQQPGGLLMVAGAHRRAGNGAADVAHRTDSIFDALANALAQRGLAQVQLHGFDDNSAPGHDVVLSTGTGVSGAAAHRVGDAIEAAGFALCRAWDQSCAKLEGTQNVQAHAAADIGSTFLHVEVSRTVRDDAARRAKLVRALTAVDEK
jgi:hypothetical protein